MSFDPILQSPAGIPLKVGIDIIVDGFGTQSDAAHRLMTAAFRMNDLGPLVRTIGRRIVYSQKRNIMEQRTPGGTPWAPLKHERGPGHNPGSRAVFDSGRIYDAITYREVGKDAVAVGTFDVPYAGFQRKGTRPHTIVPKTKKRLRFWSGGQYVFAKRVHHPGSPARDWVGVRDDDVPTVQALAAAFAEAAFQGRSVAA